MQIPVALKVLLAWQTTVDDCISMFVQKASYLQFDIMKYDVITGRLYDEFVWQHVCLTPATAVLDKGDWGPG